MNTERNLKDKAYLKGIATIVSMQMLPTSLKTHYIHELLGKEIGV
jgi:hypothetical protein